MRLPFLAVGAAQPGGVVEPPNQRVRGLSEQRQESIGSPQVMPSVGLTEQRQASEAFSSIIGLTEQRQVSTGIGVLLEPFGTSEQRQVSTGTPASSVYANGYLYQFEIRLPVWEAGGPAVTNFLLPFVEEIPEFRTSANGGYSLSSGNDFRFETAAGVQIPHIDVFYGATTGRVVKLVNIQRSFGVAQSIFLYVGKASVGSSEQDQANARAGGWLAAYAGTSGTDLTGQGRSLTNNGAGSSNLGAWPAGDMDGVGDYLIGGAAATWLNGLAGCTFVSYHEADSTATKHEVFNIAGSAAEASIHFADTSNRITSTCRFGSSTFQYQSANERQSTDPQAVAVAWQAGAATRMAIDGTLDEAGSQGGNPSGTTSVTDTLEWGRGARSDLTYWDGRLAFLAFCNRALATAELTCMTAALSDPRLVYGMGSANLTTETNKSPVAQPVRATATAGTTTRINVTGSGYDPAGDSLTVVSATVVAGSATVTVPNASSLDVATVASASGTVTIEFVLRDAGNKTSVGRLYVAISTTDLWLFPFNKDSACHRPLGAGYQIGIPASTTNETSYSGEVSDEQAIAAAMDRIGRITFSTGAATFKYQHRVQAGDGLRRVGWRGLRASSSGSGEGFGTGGNTLVDLRMPERGISRDGFTVEYPPTNINGTPNAGDNSIVLYPEDGNPASTIAVLLNQFRYDMPDGVVPRASDGQNAEARFIRRVDLRGTDVSRSGNGNGVGASELLPPGTYLRWFEVSDPNHGPILHPLNMTGTRENVASTHILARTRVWPAKNVDGGITSAQNLGPFPYGTRFFIPPTPANRALRSAICANNRQRRLFDCLMYFGVYLVDGHGQPAANDSTKGECRIRIDNLFPSSVRTDYQGFLDRLVAQKILRPMRNPRRHASETERFNSPGALGHGWCFAGGGGPIDSAIDVWRNNAWDA